MHFDYIFLTSKKNKNKHLLNSFLAQKDTSDKHTKNLDKNVSIVRNRFFPEVTVQGSKREELTDLDRTALYLPYFHFLILK